MAEGWDRRIQYLASRGFRLPSHRGYAWNQHQEYSAYSPNQSDFESRRKSCLRKSILFQDEEFHLTEELHGEPIEWMRPHDIARLYGRWPKFFVDGVDRFDVNQGELGDCYMLAALACLCDPRQRDLFNHVVPSGQSFDRGWYAGIFHFNFWHMGKWEEVIVDDLLPTRDGELILNSSTSQRNEFWAALLEKAYAKRYGSYEAIKGGLVADAFAAFTGGVTEVYSLKGPDASALKDLFKILTKALQRRSIIGCGIFKNSPKRNGLRSGHAYSLTDMQTVTKMNGKQAHLVRVRNPHGNDAEWTGPWADGSDEWRQVSHRDQLRLGYDKENDGEFWMTFQEFMRNFDRVDVCNLEPDCPEGVDCRWHSFEFTASLGTNPQFLVELQDPDNDGSSTCTFLVQLMQSDRTSSGGRKTNLDPIGFSVYEKRPPWTDMGRWIRVYHSEDHYTCQVVKRFKLPRGQYLVAPFKMGTDRKAKVFFRVFFEEGNTASLLE